MVATMMSTKTWWIVIFILFVGIVVTSGFLIALPSSKPPASITNTGTSTPDNTATSSAGDGTTSTPPLSSKVIVTTPEAKQQVSHMFTVAGVAPGPWFFEAQFPMQVRDSVGNIVGRTTAHAEGDWETSKLVTFTANMQIDANFHGAAKLILMKDNPSGLPENDDAVEVPIMVD